MGAIPCEQVIHAVDDADRNMSGVRQRTVWERKAVDQRHSECIGFGQRVEHGNPVENIEPPFCGIRITSRSFEQHGIGDEEVKVVTPFVPPLARGLLLGCLAAIESSGLRQAVR